MMLQYYKYRNEIASDILLMFRVGDFYEMFHSDAEEGSKLLGITLTKRNGCPLAGIPYHAVESYLLKLLKARKKVAIVDQIENARPGRLVKRSLTRIITPGTTLEEYQIDAKHNNYILAFNRDKIGFYLSWLDLTTGEFKIASESNPQRMISLIYSIKPQEILFPESKLIKWKKYQWYEDLKYFCLDTTITKLKDDIFDNILGAVKVMEALGVINLDGFGIEANNPSLGSAAALINYVTNALCTPPRNLHTLKLYRSEQYLLIDPPTVEHLEIFKSQHYGNSSGSLLEALDCTVTVSGARLLEKWLISPILDLKELTRRQVCVGVFLAYPIITAKVRKLLSQVCDVERILSRLQNYIRSPRGLGSILKTLKILPVLIDTLKCSADSISSLGTKINDFCELRRYLECALKEELPVRVQDGSIINNGFDEQLDKLRFLRKVNRLYLAELEGEERKITGIKSLKIKYSRFYGYSIEVSKANLKTVPKRYIRIQTMTNCERFVTENLQKKEKEIINLEELALRREIVLFNSLVASVLEQSELLRKTAYIISEIDLFSSWSVLARDNDYCCPRLDNSDQLNIKQGRHAVVEQHLKKNMLSSNGFIPNDVSLSSSNKQIALITGPNMAGKSTYIRQTALIVLMSQIGCWVPAKSCHVGLVDQIFSRVGASDDLVSGKSTFMVEMSEMARILNYATINSLIILDEIGRGTSTYDGISIAWSIIEYIHNQIGSLYRGPRTMFATHYHELTQLENSLYRLRNYSVTVKECDNEIRFLYRVNEGAVNRSYGIAVAQLSGLPKEVIERAKILLNKMEKKST